jgi:hypothetical protein
MAFNLPVASFKSFITGRIATTDVTILVDSMLDDVGTVLSGVKGFVIDEGTDSEEVVIGTCATTGLTGCLRGISPTDGLTEVTALKKVHLKNATIKISTHPYLVRVIRALNGTDGFDATALLKYASAATLTPGSQQLATVAYADGLAIAGAPDASATSKGIVEIATAAEVAAGDDTGTTTAPLAVLPSALASTIQSGSYLYAVEDGTGSDDTYTATLTPSLTAYTAGMTIVVKLTVANTTACTLNINSLGAKTIKKWVSGALADLETGDIAANYTGIFEYDGTYFVLVSSSAAFPLLSTLSEALTFFGATDITGAEAETLSSGSTSNADALHTHTPYPSFFSTQLTYGTLTTGQLLYSQFCLNADKTYGYLTLVQGASSDIYVYRFARDSATKLFIYDGTNVQLSNATYSWSSGGVVTAGTTYVWVVGRTGTDRKIIRLAADLTSPTVMTMSGSADPTATLSACGTDSLLYLQKNTSTLLQYSISGTTATRGSDITLTSGGDFTDFDGTNFFSYLASSQTLKKYAVGGGAASTTAIKEFANTANISVSALDTGCFGLCSIDSTKMYLVTGRLIDSATAGKDGFALDFRLITKI